MLSLKNHVVYLIIKIKIKKYIPLDPNRTPSVFRFRGGHPNIKRVYYIYLSINRVVWSRVFE